MKPTTFVEHPSENVSLLCIWMDQKNLTSSFLGIWKWTTISVSYSESKWHYCICPGIRKCKGSSCCGGLNFDIQKPHFNDGDVWVCTHCHWSYIVQWNQEEVWQKLENLTTSLKAECDLPQARAPTSYVYNDELAATILLHMNTIFIFFSLHISFIASWGSE